MANKVIPPEVVEETWQTISQYTVDQMITEQNKFVESQPHVVAFILAFTEDLAQESTELILYVANVIWQIFQKAGEQASPGQEIPTVSQDEIMNCYDNRVKWLETLNRLEPEAQRQAVWQDLNAIQPYVSQYVLEAFTEEEEGESEVMPFDDVAYGYLLLSAVIEAFDQKYQALAPSGPPAGGESGQGQPGQGKSPN